MPVPGDHEPGPDRRSRQRWPNRRKAALLTFDITFDGRRKPHSRSVAPGARFAGSPPQRRADLRRYLTAVGLRLRLEVQEAGP